MGNERYPARGLAFSAHQSPLGSVLVLLAAIRPRLLAVDMLGPLPIEVLLRCPGSDVGFSTSVPAHPEPTSA